MPAVFVDPGSSSTPKAQGSESMPCHTRISTERGQQTSPSEETELTAFLLQESRSQQEPSAVRSHPQDATGLVLTALVSAVIARPEGKAQTP